MSEIEAIRWLNELSKNEDVCQFLIVIDSLDWDAQVEISVSNDDRVGVDMIQATGTNFLSMVIDLKTQYDQR